MAVTVRQLPWRWPTWSPPHPRVQRRARDTVWRRQHGRPVQRSRTHRHLTHRPRGGCGVFTDPVDRVCASLPTWGARMGYRSRGGRVTAETMTLTELAEA